MWAQEHVTWKHDDWKRVLWSNETRVCLFGSDGLIRSWRKSGERLNKENLRPTVKHGGGKYLLKHMYIMYLPAIVYFLKVVLWFGEQ